MSELLPYKIQYSTGNVNCTKCNFKVRMDDIQIAIMIQSDEDDCYNPEWFHDKCFFQTRRPSTEAGFDGFALMRYADQRAIRDELGIVNKVRLHSSEPNTLDFGIEYANHNRDACIDCHRKILKNTVRIMKVMHDINQNTVFDGNAVWFHIECFARTRFEHGWLESAEKMPGFTRLTEKDKEIVKRQIPNKTNEPNNIEMHLLEKEIESQNEKYYKAFDELAQLSSEERITILKYKHQFVPATDFEIHHHLTDVVVFGALEKCPKCTNRNLVFRNTKYVCAHESAWVNCGHTTDTPPRIMTRMPKALLQKYPFLKQYQSISDRALHRFQWTDENGNDLVFGVYKSPKLFNMTFVIIGSLSKSNEIIEEIIWKMGGKVVDEIKRNLTAVLSNREEVKRMGSHMKKAKKYNIHVISEEFLTAIEITDPIPYIVSQSLCDWGRDPYKRIEQNDVKSRRETIFYTKSVPAVMTYKLKDGTAVDTDSELVKNAHVYRKYSVVLGFVNITNNKNSYYRLQLLESDDTKLYWIFEAWGRISTTIGSKRIQSYDTLQEARDRFNFIYNDKTGNIFGTMSMSKKNAGKFYHLDINICPKVDVSKTFVETKLNQSVYDLMRMIFDLKRMEKMINSFELDLKQMPLGVISSKQIHLAMTVLQRIEWLIQHNRTAGRLEEESNKFYTMIPHAFDVKRPRIIDTLEIVNAKNEMLESLLNLELIYGFLNEENGEKSNPFDACYLKLHNEIEPIDKNSPEFQILIDVVRTTHGPTHDNYTLEVLDIFKLKREGEDERFTRFKKLGGHRLLWHGSRFMNFVSILTNGLKIAPPEAPVTGYMFGKGIYFADIVSKSANYCFTTPNNNIGLMLLCEVALGQRRQLIDACNVTNIPNQNENSVKALGIFYPKNYANVDRVKINSGPIRRQVHTPTALRYNEYIVYDPAQVKLKYLFKMKFHFKPAQ